MTAKILQFPDLVAKRPEPSTALRMLMLGTTPEKERLKKVAADSQTEANFRKGSRAALKSDPWKVPAGCDGMEYAYGYFYGYARRYLGVEVNWPAVFVALDAQRPKMRGRRPRHRPRSRPVYLRNVNIMFDLFHASVLAERKAEKRKAKLRPLADIVADTAERFGVSERTTWSIWGNPNEFLPADLVTWFRWKN